MPVTPEALYEQMLVIRSQTGDESAFRELVGIYGPRLLLFAQLPGWAQPPQREPRWNIKPIAGTDAKQGIGARAWLRRPGLVQRRDQGAELVHEHSVSYAELGAPSFRR